MLTTAVYLNNDRSKAAKITKSSFYSVSITLTFRWCDGG